MLWKDRGTLSDQGYLVREMRYPEPSAGSFLLNRRNSQQIIVCGIRVMEWKTRRKISEIASPLFRTVTSRAATS